MNTLKYSFILFFFYPTGAGLAGISPLAIELSDGEKTVLAAVVDNNQAIDEAAFWMLRGKIAESYQNLPPHSQNDSPSYANLIKNPSFYRGQAINLNATVYVCEEMSAGKTLGWPVRKKFPQGTKLWRLSCLQDNAPDQPLTIYCVTKPQQILSGKSARDKKNPDTRIFPKGYRCIFTGVFYKNVLLEESTTVRERLYPIILAYGCQPAEQNQSGDSTAAVSSFMVAGIAIMAAGFVILRRHVTKIKKTGIAKSPVDSTGVIEENEQPAENAENMDPDLVKAVEEFRKDHE